MNAELAVQNVLTTNAPFTAVVSNRVFYDEIMQTEQVPLAIVTLQSVAPTDVKDGPSDFDLDKVSVFLMAETKLVSSTLATLARAALDRISGTFNAVKVVSIKFLDQSTFTEQLINKKIYTTEQIYQVITKP